MESEQVEVISRVQTDDALVSFFYQLMRDNLPLGVVEGNIAEMEESDAHEFVLTNKYLAGYARSCVERLRRISYEHD